MEKPCKAYWLSGLDEASFVQPPEPPTVAGAL
jgi:hypothetical protein